jgi:hypothetical protein
MATGYFDKSGSFAELNVLREGIRARLAKNALLEIWALIVFTTLRDLLVRSHLWCNKYLNSLGISTANNAPPLFVFRWVTLMVYVNKIGLVADFTRIWATNSYANKYNCVRRLQRHLIVLPFHRFVLLYRQEMRLVRNCRIKFQPELLASQRGEGCVPETKPLWVVALRTRKVDWIVSLLFQKNFWTGLLLSSKFYQVNCNLKKKGKCCLHVVEHQERVCFYKSY